MRILISGGDVLKKEYFKELLDTDISIYNTYGPTETTVCATYYKVDYSDENETIPIGKPIANSQVMILNGDVLCGIGVPGELCIAGDCVGEGYLNRPELTKEKFVDNPFSEGKLYKTGDLAYWREDGNVVFVGRNDFQIKINGQRIELGEIEAAMSALDGIESAAVTVRKDENDRQLLCAFYTGIKASTSDLCAALGKSLPHYMILTMIC
jgi:non-ribosomal peptide synthetase component F